MNLLPVAALVAVLITGAIACVALAVRPRRRTMAEVRALLHGEAASAPARRDGVDRSHGSWTALGVRLANGGIGERVRERFGSGLVLIDRSTADVVSQLLVGTVAGTCTIALCVGALVGTGALPASPVWAAVVVMMAPLSCAVMWSDVAGRIERRRRELRRAVNDFVQLTSVGLTTDQSVEEAIAFALSVGESEMFDLLRHELHAAPARGVPLWEALDALGELHGERALCELASSIERQGMHGVSISDTVATLAGSMRAKALDDLERDADRANANLSGPTVGFVVATLVFLAYPLMLRISDAFGG